MEANRCVGVPHHATAVIVIIEFLNTFLPSLNNEIFHIPPPCFCWWGVSPDALGVKITQVVIGVLHGIGTYPFECACLFHIIGIDNYLNLIRAFPVILYPLHTIC